MVLQAEEKMMSRVAKLLLISFYILFNVTYFSASAQDKNSLLEVSGLEALFTTPLNYTTYYTREEPLIDGDISDKVWQNASWTNFFTDIEGEKKPKPFLNTRVKMLWDDTYLYLAADLEEPHVWATLRNHDDIIFYDNDFEVFIDPSNDGHQYFEIEINALNTIFDLFMPKPYRNNSGALIPWDAKGLKSAVKVNGTLNDPTNKDRGWTLEMAIPFSSISLGNTAIVPDEGSLWRINFSRVQWDTEVKDGEYVKLKGVNGKVLPERNWVWSPQGVINMHFPERWGYLQFSKNRKSDPKKKFELPYPEKQKQFLWLTYYRQKEYYTKHGKYAKSLSEIGISKPEITVDGKRNLLQLEASSRQFTVTISSVGSRTWSLNDDGLIQGL